MIKTIAKTIVVLSLAIYLGIPARSAYATKKGPSCQPLSHLYTYLPLMLQKNTKQFALYTSLQLTVFRSQSSTYSLASYSDNPRQYVTEIGESDVDSVPFPTTQPTEVPVVQPTLTSPTPVTQPDATSLNAEVLFQMANAARSNVGLPPFEKDERICSVAASRGPELYNEIMVTHTMHAGFYARNLPYWASENVIYMRTEEEAFTWWMGSPVHRASILGDYKYACGVCVGHACNMIFTNFTAKQTTPSSV